jgi:hypothetical protein
MARQKTPQQVARELREAEQVRDMVESHAGWKVLKKRIDDRTAQVLDEITKGTLCHDEYRSYTGELKGLRRIDTILDRLLRQAQGGPEDV